MLEVIAVDRANRTGRTPCHFLVSEGTPVRAQWNLADEAGNPEAHEENERFSATAGPAFTFGVDGPGGKIDKAAASTAAPTPGWTPARQCSTRPRVSA